MGKTFRDLIAQDDPFAMDYCAPGGVRGCPCEYGYESDYPDCSRMSCAACWDREIPGEKPGGVLVPKAGGFYWADGEEE